LVGHVLDGGDFRISRMERDAYGGLGACKWIQPLSAAAVVSGKSPARMDGTRSRGDGGADYVAQFLVTGVFGYARMTFGGALGRLHALWPPHMFWPISVF
jgi:hypothetical protein